MEGSKGEAEKIVDLKQTYKKQASLVRILFIICYICLMQDCQYDSPFLWQEAVPGDAEMDDDDYEDENWGNLEGEVITVELEQNNYGLGLSLAGAKVTDFFLLSTFLNLFH